MATLQQNSCYQDKGVISVVTPAFVIIYDDSGTETFFHRERKKHNKWSFNFRGKHRKKLFNPRNLSKNEAMVNRAADWLKQSLRDLEQAKDSRRAERHEWAFFAAHQTAEKAIKALHLSLGQEGWGHILARLLSELPESVPVPEGMIDKGRVLDNFYIPTRYPNGHPEGAPFEHYGQLQSEEAIAIASEITEFISLQMA